MKQSGASLLDLAINPAIMVVTALLLLRFWFYLLLL